MPERELYGLPLERCTSFTFEVYCSDSQGSFQQEVDEVIIYSSMYPIRLYNALLWGICMYVFAHMLHYFEIYV